MQDRQNVADFSEVMKEVYSHQKSTGAVNKNHRKKLDRLFSMGLHERVVTRDGRILLFWRTFRRRVAIMYARQHRLPVRFQLDWRYIFDWILDNWQRIVRMIIFLVPLFI